MSQNISIGFTSPDHIICTLMARFDISRYYINIIPTQDNPDIHITITDDGLQIEDDYLKYPILLHEFIAKVRNLQQP